MAEVIAETSVDRVAFDFGVEFLLGDGGLVRIEGRATIGDGTASMQAFDAESVGSSALALLGFLHQPVRVALNDSTLIMQSLDGALALVVEPSREFEDWCVVLADGSRFVCSDDGAVTRWSPSPPE